MRHGIHCEVRGTIERAGSIRTTRVSTTAVGTSGSSSQSGRPVGSVEPWRGAERAESVTARSGSGRPDVPQHGAQLRPGTAVARWRAAATASRCTRPAVPVPPTGPLPAGPCRPPGSSGPRRPRAALCAVGRLARPVRRSRAKGSRRRSKHPAARRDRPNGHRRPSAGRLSSGRMTEARGTPRGRWAMSASGAVLRALVLLALRQGAATVPTAPPVAPGSEPAQHRHHVLDPTYAGGTPVTAVARPPGSAPAQRCRRTTRSGNRHGAAMSVGGVAQRLVDIAQRAGQPGVVVAGHGRDEVPLDDMRVNRRGLKEHGTAVIGRFHQDASAVLR